MHGKNDIGRNTSIGSRFSTAQKKSAIAAAVIAGLGLMAIPRSAHADLLLWTNGAADNAWNGSSADWNDLSNSTNGVAYTDGSAVQFSDSGPGGSIAVGTVSTSPGPGATPASVEFTHGTGTAGNYTFTDGTGTSGIEGAGTFTLDAGYAGTVYLSGQDNLTGTATVSGGTLQLTGSAGSTLGTGSIVLNGGALAFQHSLTAMANNITADQTMSGIVSNSTSDNVVFVGTLSSTAGATDSNTVLNFTGGSTDTQAPLTATNNWAGFTGQFNFGSTGQILRMQATAVTGTLGSPTALFNLGTGAGVLEMENNTGEVLIGALEGSSTTSIEAATHSGSNTNADFIIGGAGTNTVYNGTINSNANARATIEVTGGGSLTLSNGGISTISGSLAYGSKTGTAPGYQGAGTTILGNGQEPMAGTLTTFLTANASNGGGQLYVSNTTGSPTGVTPVYIEGASSATNNGNGIAGGLLGGDGIIQGEVSTIKNTVNNITDSATPLANFAAGPHIAPGAAGTNTSMVLTLSGGLQLGDWTNLDMSMDTTPIAADNALIAVSNTTSGNGQVANSLVLPGDNNIQVNFTFPNGAPETGVAYNLISYTGADLYTGGTPSSLPWSATGLPAGYTVKFGDTGVPIDPAVNFITATFSAAAVPEPASLGLLAFGALGLLSRRRGQQSK